MNKSQKIIEDIFPKRGEYLNLTELVAECERINVPISRRTIHNYVKDKILPKPVHQGLEALFHKEFIVEEIRAVHVLKSIFHVTYADLKILATNSKFNLQDIVKYLVGVITHLQENNQGKIKRRPMLVNLANESFLQDVARRFLVKIMTSTNLKGKTLIDLMDEAVNEAFLGK